MRNRWQALLIIFLSFIQFTLNWFNIVPAFGSLGAEMKLALPQLGLVIGMFVAGYGIAHIPGGLLAERFGLRFAMLLGIAVESIGTIVSACAPDYQVLLAGRFVCGVGGSIYIGGAVGLTTAWFRDHELATANGLITGVAFTLGAALGLHGWSAVVAAFGWREAQWIGATIGIVSLIGLALCFPTPQSQSRSIASGTTRQHDLSSLRRTLRNRTLWILGFGFAGGYGSYLTAVQLLSVYATHQVQMSAREAGSLGVILMTSGVVGSVLGGWIADKIFGLVATIIGAWLLEALALVILPEVGPTGLPIVAAAIGTTSFIGFVAWVALPGQYRDEVELSDIPIACGLMLTVAAIGGVVIPAVYGRVAVAYGYPAAWRMLSGLTLATTMCCFMIPRPNPLPFRDGSAEATLE